MNKVFVKLRYDMGKKEVFSLAEERKGCFNCGWGGGTVDAAWVGCDRDKGTSICWMTIEEANEVREQEKILDRGW